MKSYIPGLASAGPGICVKREAKRSIKMVKHIVAFTFAEGVDKVPSVKFIAGLLEPLVGQIPGLLHMEVRRCFSGMDYALYSEFEKAEDVPAYRAHPLHREAKKHFHHLLDQRYSADYEA